MFANVAVGSLVHLLAELNDQSHCFMSAAIFSSYSVRRREKFNAIQSSTSFILIKPNCKISVEKCIF